MSNQQQMAISDFNLIKLSTKEFSEHVSCTIELGGNCVGFGRRGTGKTEICKKQIQDSGCKEVYINLSVLERVDMGGYPNIMGAKEKFVDYLLPSFYEKMIEGNEPVVALLDEVDKADPSLWAPLLEFTQFRTINHRPLPNLKAILMTGNLLSEGGNRPSPPLLDRTEKFLVEADSTSWLNWAGKSGRIHPSILAFITNHPNELFGAVDPEDRYADPSPRGWDRASQILFQGEKFGWNSALLNQKVAGCVGKDAGIKYSFYFEHYMELIPMIDDLYQGKDVSAKYEKLETTKKFVACMIACAKLAAELDRAKSKEDLPESVKYVGRFLHTCTHENTLVAVRSQITLDRLVKFDLDEHQDWIETLKKINRSVHH